ncbi:MAG: hypothetical protein ABFD97_15670 [Syntrophobacter sp.]
MAATINALLNKALNTGCGRSRVENACSLAPRHEAKSHPKKEVRAGNSDTLALSQPYQALRDIGVDLTNSTFREEAQMFNFNLQYTDERLKNVSANGYYDSRSQSLQVDFSFCSALSIKDSATGEEHQELFQFDFHLEASRIQTFQGEHKVVKEDIIHFARKILGTISKLHAEGKSIDGLVLDSEDLKELAAVDDGKLLKSIMLIIDLLRNVDRMRGRNGDHVLLAPERDKTEFDERREQDEQSFSMSLSVRRLSVDSTRTSANLLGGSSTDASTEIPSVAGTPIEAAPIQETPEPALTSAA